MGRILIGLLPGLLVSVLACGEVWAQATAQINGRVTDQTGAALPGVELRGTQTATGLARSAVSDETGAYVFTNLPIGPYRIEATLPGFQTYVQTGIVLQVGSNPVVNPVLEVGQVTQTVEVQADVAMVETRNTDIGAVMENQRVLELPLNGRNATDLVFLTAGATPGTTSGLNSGVRNYPTADISIAGGLASGTIYLLDGGVHNDPFNNQSLPLPFPDALQEFRVQTSAIPAQYGHHSAAAVNGVTKSGTNEFHGGLFEFLRDDRLNARNAFATESDGLKRNQFGGTIGGPIVRDKLFFFGALQTTLERRRPTTAFAFIPTAEVLRGDFRTITSRQCSINPITLTGGPFTGSNNQVNPALFNRASMNILRRSTFPTTSDPCGRINITRRETRDTYDIVSRVDFQASAEHNMFTRFLAARLDQPSDFSADNMLAYSNAALAMRVYSAVFGDTYIIGPNTVSSFRASLNRGNIPKIQAQSFGGPDVGINMWPGVPGVLRVAISNGFTISSNLGTPTKYNHTSFQLGEDVSMVRGPHQFGFGASYVWASFNGTSGLNASGPFTFNGSVHGHGLADFMLGRPSAFSQSNETNSDPRNIQFGMYVQDTWKATPKLTVNAGLRWDPFITDYAKRRDWVAHFSKELFDRGVRSTVYRNAPAGLIFPGDAAYPGDGYWKTRWMYFGPRLGLAWDPGGDGRLSVRAAYGLLYDHAPFGRYIGYSQSAPIGGVIQVPFPPSFDNPWANYPGGNPFPIIKDKNFPFQEGASFQNASLDMKPTYSQQWNLSIQRQLGSDVLVSAAYVGTALVNLWTSNENNPGILIPGGNNTAANVPQRRLLTLQNPDQGRFYSGGIRTTTSDGTGSFHGMMLSVQRRSSSGLTLQGNYTWSHCIQDIIDLGSTGGQISVKPFNRRSSRSNCDLTDRRHVMNVSSVYRTPFSNPILRNWQLSGIVTLRSGQFLSVTAGTDRALNGVGGQLANQILPDAYTPNRSLDSWLNPAAFAIPALGTYGNMSPLSIGGPGSVRIDMGLTRSFQITEGQDLQFRIEAFNLPNHLNPGNPVIARNNSNFGRILTAMDPRIMQIAVKYTY